ncbi:hypothetical protein RUM44_000788 [Polyplax serrata]|uniref:Uncharacterized protein n=1 Tax=Polyplax serrata TaxID=468196 RepID=A0ABR1B8L4_POLSC
MQTLGESRAKVNGKFLPNYSGKPVSIIGKVVKVHSNGTLFEMQTTDNQNITVLLNEPISVALEGWIEVRGNGQGKSNVICHQVLLLNDIIDTFDADTYDDLINVINSCPNPWSTNKI